MMGKSPPAAGSRTNQAKPFYSQADLKLVLITRKWAPAVGGMETWSLNVANALDEQASTSVISLPGRENGMPPSALALLLFPLTVLRRYLGMDRKPDSIVLGDMAIWPIGVLLKLFGFRGTLLIAAHGTDTSYHRRPGLKAKLYGIYQRIGSRMMRQTIVFANSRATADVLKETGWTASKIIPLATLLLGDHQSIPDERAAIELLFAGRLVERKGCAWFVKHVIDRLPDDTVLKIAGTGWDVSEAWVSEHPQVEYLGALDRPALDRAYANADCVIMPNIETSRKDFEGFGLIALEAAAAGGIVIAADHSGLRDAVIDGETGFHVASGDAEAWARKILEIHKWDRQNRQDFIAKSRASIALHFSWETVARRIINLTKDCR